MTAKGIHIFWNTSGALLVAAATALLIGLHAGAGLIWPPDAILQISLRAIYWIFAGMALAGALVCLFSQSTRLKASLILWLTFNALVYAIGAQWGDSKGDFSAYLANVASAFAIAPATAGWLAKIVWGYLLLGSCAALYFGKSEDKIKPSTPVKIAENKPIQNVSVRFLKISCTACGGHIEFPTNSFGERIPCPHCQASIILQKPRNIKISCAACEGHVEFPDYALGQKIPCPHCNMDITLKEPA